MRGNLVILNFVLVFCLLVLIMALVGDNAWAQRSNRLATSALIIGDSSQFAECSVSNISNNPVSVDIELVALGSPTNFPDVVVQPDRTTIVDVSLPAGTEFFCKFRTRNTSRIRAAARVLDPSIAVLQRAEAR